MPVILRTDKSSILSIVAKAYVKIGTRVTVMASTPAGIFEAA